MDLIALCSESRNVSEAKINALFEKYKDATEDAILSEECIYAIYQNAIILTSIYLYQLITIYSLYFNR